MRPVYWLLLTTNLPDIVRKLLLHRRRAAHARGIKLHSYRQQSLRRGLRHLVLARNLSTIDRELDGGRHSCSGCLCTHPHHHGQHSLFATRNQPHWISCWSRHRAVRCSRLGHAPYRPRPGPRRISSCYTTRSNDVLAPTRIAVRGLVAHGYSATAEP